MILLITVFFSFVVLVCYFYGEDINAFNGFYSSFIYLFGVILGNNNENFKMLNYSASLTLIFQLTYSFLFLFIMINMIFVIIKNEFSKSIKKIEKKKNKNLESILNYKISFFSRIKTFLKTKIYLKILKICNYDKYERKIEKRKFFEREIDSDYCSNNHWDFDINYSDVVNKYEINNDKKYVVDYEKQKMVKNFKRREALLICRFIANILFFSLLIISFLSLFSIEKDCNQFLFIKRKLETSSKLDFKNSEFSLKKLTNSNELMTFITRIFPSIFKPIKANVSSFKNTKFQIFSTDKSNNSQSMNYFFSNSLLLVNEKVRITINKNKIIPNKSPHYNKIQKNSIEGYLLKIIQQL